MLPKTVQDISSIMPSLESGPDPKFDTIPYKNGDGRYPSQL